MVFTFVHRVVGVAGMMPPPSALTTSGLTAASRAAYAFVVMNALSVYIEPSGASVLHRSGFSWLAALAWPLWALHRRLWWVLLASLPLTFALHTVVNWAIGLVPGDTAQGVLALAWLIGWSLAAGRWANALHRHLLERAGYRMTATELPALEQA
jgi:hypothetical protein